MKNGTNYLLRLANFLIVTGLLCYSYMSIHLGILWMSLCWAYLLTFIIIEVEYMLRRIGNNPSNLRDCYKSDSQVHRLLRCSLMIIEIITPEIIGILTFCKVLKGELPWLDNAVLLCGAYILMISSIRLIIFINVKIREKYELKNK